MPAEQSFHSFTAQSEANSNNTATLGVTGTDVYVQLDKYFADACLEIALGAPLDDITLIEYLVPSFNRFHAGAQSANRLLNYVNRHYVKRAVDEDRGWLRRSDLLNSITKALGTEDPFVTQEYREKRLEELKKWGANEGASPERIAFAEACAEAASPTDRVVPILSMAHRRFRTEFVEVLLATPKMKGKGKAKASKSASGPSSVLNRPKGRLARAVKELLESQQIGEEKRYQLVSGVARTLELIGIRDDHLLRKRLDKFLASSTFGSPDPSITTETSAKTS